MSGFDGARNLGLKAVRRLQAVPKPFVRLMRRRARAGEHRAFRQDAEAIDLANARDGGPADNRDAWRARHFAAIEGSERGPNPELYISRGIADITEATRAVEFGRGARDLLEQGGIEVTYVETPAPHAIDPAALEAASGWLAETLP